MVSASDEVGRETVEEHRDDVATLTTALDHVSRWAEFRISNGLQVLNYFLLATAVLATAYVSAIDGKLRAVAVAVALAGFAVTVAAFLVGKEQRRVAALAEAPLAELQNRLAEQLGIDSLRMIRRESDMRRPTSAASAMTSTLVLALAAAISLGAAIYATLI